jgi:HlyD family secretion protein
MTALAAVLVVALVAGITVVRLRAGAAPNYATAAVTQGTLVQTATASGTVNPQDTITVGTQVSGTISQLFVDYNSQVKAGQVLAKLDPTQFQAALAQAEAGLAQAEGQANAAGANAQGALSSVTASQEQAAALQATQQSDQAAIANAQANVTKSQAALVVAQQTLARDKTLLSQGFLAQSQYDADNSNLVAAQSTVSSSQSALSQARLSTTAASEQAKASYAQAAQSQSAATSSAATAQANQAAVAAAEANVQQAQLNLQHTIITSPVDGTVIARDVSIGQTVAASLQTPTLFSIAKDLGKMEVDVAVGENDIGKVAAGDVVDFTVLAYPNQVFNGTVAQVRENPTTVSNVVTYDTVVLVNNQQGLLRPGMTANASIHVAQANDALIVPLAALSYHPANGTFKRRTTSGTAAPKPAAAANGAPWGATLGGGSSATVAGGRGRVFVDAGGKLTPVPVQITLVSGTQAAVTPLRGTLTANDQVVISDSAARSSSSGAHQAAGGAGGPGGLARGLR